MPISWNDTSHRTPICALWTLPPTKVSLIDFSELHSICRRSKGEGARATKSDRHVFLRACVSVTRSVHLVLFGLLQSSQPHWSRSFCFFFFFLWHFPTTALSGVFKNYALFTFSRPRKGEERWGALRIRGSEAQSSRCRRRIRCFHFAGRALFWSVFPLR